MTTVGGGSKIFKLVSPGEDQEPRATYYLRSDGAYMDTSVGMGLLPVQWSLDWAAGGWSAPNPACATNPADCFDTYQDFGGGNGGNTCNRIFTDYSGSVGCYPLSGQRCFSDGFECGHQLISDFELRIQTPLCTGAGIVRAISFYVYSDSLHFTPIVLHYFSTSITFPFNFQVRMNPPGVPRFSARCDADGFAKVLQIHTAAYTPTAAAIAPASITQCNSGSLGRVGPLYCSSITPFQMQSGVHCDAGTAGCNAFGQTTGPGTDCNTNAIFFRSLPAKCRQIVELPLKNDDFLLNNDDYLAIGGTGVAGGAVQCVQTVMSTQRLWSDRDYAWTTGPTDILDGVWSYVMVSTNDEFCIKNENFCIKNKRLCIKNEEFCI